MRKINNSRRGFTLVEIVVVVAIIVIISGVTAVGVAVTLQNAETSGNQIELHANHFEESAWAKVNSIGVGAVDFSPIQEHTPEVSPTPTPEQEAAEAEKTAHDEEIEAQIQELIDSGVPEDKIWVTKDDKGHITDWGYEHNSAPVVQTTTAPTSTPKPTATPTPTNTPKPTPTTKPTTSSNAVTVPSNSYSRSDVQYSWGHTVTQSNFSFSDAKYDNKKVTVTITYSGDVSYNQNSNFSSAEANGNTVTCVIDNYSHYKTNYGVTVNGDVKVTNVVITAE